MSKIIQEKSPPLKKKEKIFLKNIYYQLICTYYYIVFITLERVLDFSKKSFLEKSKQSYKFNTKTVKILINFRNFKKSSTYL